MATYPITTRPSGFNLLYFDNLFDISFSQGANYNWEKFIPTKFPNKNRQPHISYRFYNKLNQTQNDYNIGCAKNHYVGNINNKEYFIYLTKSSGSSFNSTGFIAELDNNTYEYNVYDISLPNISSSTMDFYTAYYRLDNFKYSESACDNGIINQNIYEELQYYPNDYLPSMLYIAFPVLIFLITLKILRKGLFK